jgi:hypothetical protein
VRGELHQVYLTGASEGGIVTALAIERKEGTFDGGLAACGPVGDFRKQINYWGDFRVLFDYYFPGVLPGSPIEIPPYVISDWDEVYKGDVREALMNNPDKALQLVKVARVPVDLSDPEATLDELVQLIWYNVFATQDGIDKLGGQPYSNRWRWYSGSEDDRALNRSVFRTRADWRTVAEIQKHNTTGEPTAPIVMLHSRDPIIPYWHEPIYRLKIASNGNGDLHTVIPSLRYGHCNFSTAQILVSFLLLVYQVEGSLPQGIENVLPTQASVDEYHDLARSHGLE